MKNDDESNRAGQAVAGMWAGCVTQRDRSLLGWLMSIHRWKFALFTRRHGRDLLLPSRSLFLLLINFLISFSSLRNNDSFIIALLLSVALTNKSLKDVGLLFGTNVNIVFFFPQSTHAGTHLFSFGNGFLMAAVVVVPLTEERHLTPPLNEM